MKIICFFIFLIIFFFQSSNSVNIECDFNDEWGYMILGTIYRCEVNNEFYIQSPGNAFAHSVAGEHKEGLNDTDVLGFDSRSQTIEYFPRNLDAFFINLKSIVINNGRIKEIHASEMQPFTEMISFDFDENDIEILEDGLFENNTSLQKVSFVNNKIYKIKPGVFENLVKMSHMWLNGNRCIDTEATDKRAVKNLVALIQHQCIEMNIEFVIRSSSKSAQLKTIFKNFEKRLENIELNVLRVLGKSSGSKNLKA